MANITQTIPALTAGISQQPDEQKIPGQVKDMVNAFPDVTQGLLKRPGGKFVASLSDNADAALNSTADGKWFHYYRDENEQYIGQVARNGAIKMWDCLTGAEKTVVNAIGNNTYLTHTGDEDIQTLTLNDFTYINNRSIETEMDTLTEPLNNFGKEVFIELKTISYARQYAFNVFNDTSTTTLTTATRIEVRRIIDSSNSCRLPTGTAPDYLETDRGQFPPSGTLPGTGAYTTMCNQQGAFSDSNHTNLDSYCPNVDTRIFKISHGDGINGNDNNFVGGTYNVVPNGGNAADRKTLFFRLSTTGQSVAQGRSSTPEYHCRYTTTHDLLHGGSGWQAGDYVDVWMKNARYRVTIREVSTATVQANLGLVRPTPTSFDTKTTVTGESILADMRTTLLMSTYFGASNVTQIGNGLYLNLTSEFNASTPVPDLLNVVAGKVNDVGDLPSQCKHGMVVEVINSEAEEDNYFVKFFGKLKSGGDPNNDSDYLDGEGTWEECAKPGRKIRFKRSTMPIALIRTADGNFRLTELDGSSYTVSTNDGNVTAYAPVWEDCLVGDDVTNKEPSFIGKTINKLLFFRNRFAILADENIVLSAAGEFTNFWAKSAITLVGSDPIDITASSEYPAILFDGIQVNTGLVLFSKNQQFMLTTDSDAFTPLTAKINALSTYNFNHQTNPISLGTTLGFLDNAGKNSRFFEMANVIREGEPSVIEQSAVVSRLFENDLQLISNSRENSVIFFSEDRKANNNNGTDTLYGYRYFDQINERKLASWFKWKLTGTIQYHCIQDDSLFVVVQNNGKRQLLKYAIKMDSNTFALAENRVHLDHLMSTSGWQYANGKSTKPKPVGLESTNQLVAYDVDAGNNLGRYAKVTFNSGTGNLEIDGDWSSETFLIGYEFTMEVKLPTIYYVTQSGQNWRSDTTANTILHRVKFGFGPLGVYETTLSRKGRMDYTETFEVTAADSYAANTAGIVDDNLIRTVPIYDRNINASLTLKSTHPAPATIHNMTWEGVYTTNNYTRV
tara:strand:- start:125 stop:3163 length:3039 start_codon:yes stop_codon:yes gene_type:complete